MSLADSDNALRRALSALERSRAKIEAAERERSEPIAIVGAGCRLPGGVQDLDGFWSLLERGVDAVTEWPAQRWHAEDLWDADRNRPGKVYSRAMAVLDEPDAFDAAFFGISGREAERMDPQQRIMLEVAVDALEHAGLGLDALRGSDTAAFIGICANDFGQRFPPETLDTYSATGRSLSTASGRLSYLFGWHGPAMSVDTACSSSLVAVHLACQSLRRRETSLALVGGVHVTGGAETSVGMAKLNALSPTGRCRAFSADGDGYVRGEGCVALVLKRLGDAQRDGDAILATIRASAVNQDGRSNGLTAPNGAAQLALLRACLRESGLQAHDVGYLEAHGTGTELGDPIELTAIAAAYGAQRPAQAPLWVGSGKTNVGHLEAAAGIAGLLRAALSLRHATIPPNLHFTAPNPHFDWNEPLRVPTAPTAFPVNGGGSRVAGVSSFGFSGTNAHVLLEQAPRAPASSSPAPAPAPAWLVLSAASDEALRARCRQLARRAAASPGAAAVLAGEARFRAGVHGERLAVVASDPQALVERLAAHGRGEAVEDVHRGSAAHGRAGVVAVFPGQGAHWEGMGRELYADPDGAFRRSFDACDAAVRAHGGPSVVEALHASGWSENGFESEVMQPLLFALALSQAEHLRALGVRFTAVVGQSLGEVAAAVFAGALTLDEGARIVTLRGGVTMRAAGGAMAMVELSLEDVRAHIARSGLDLTPAASNAPTATLVSGEAEAIEAIVARWTAEGVFCRRLRVSYASHSPFMSPLLAPLRQGLAGLAPRAAVLPIQSTVTGRPIDGTALTADYWCDNLRQAVMLYPAVAGLLEAGHRVFVELGPKPMLQASIEEAMRVAGVQGCVTGCASDDEPAGLALARALARLGAHGAPVPRPAPEAAGSWPAYPWARESYPLPAFRPSAGGEAGADVLRHATTLAGQAGTWVFEGRLSAAHPLVAEHRVDGVAVLPGAACLRMAWQAGSTLWPGRLCSVRDARFEKMLAFGAGEADGKELQLQVVLAGEGEATWRLCSREIDGGRPGDGVRWTEHAHGRLAAEASIAPPPGLATSPEEAVRALSRQAGAEAIYAALAGMGLDYGAGFQGVESLRHDGQAFLARMRPREGEGAGASDAFLLDASLHGIAWLGREVGAGALVPVASTRLSLDASAGRAVWAHGVRRAVADASGAEASEADLVLWDERGRVAASWQGLRARGLDAGGQALPAQGRWLHAQAWERQDDASGPDGEQDWLVVSDGAALAPPALQALLSALKTSRFVAWSRDDGAGWLAGQLQGWREAPGPRRRRAVLYLGASVGEPAASPRPRAEGSVGVMLLVQSLLRVFGEDERPGLRLVTQGTQQVGDEDAARPLPMAMLADAGVWGFARALSLEHPELRTRCIDLPSADAAASLPELARELLGASAETEVALRAARWVGRLSSVPVPEESPPVVVQPGERPWRLEIDRPGVLGSLALRETAPLELGPGEVEIEVASAALNFADVMRAMGFFLPEGTAHLHLGSECAGVVTRVAPDVRGCRPGQRVVALGGHCFASHAKAPAAFVAQIPSGVSDDEAAALPIASMTAWHALKEVARLRAGETILIHSATGGTGLAALKLARSLGAEVLATAGSEAKRRMLRELGIRHVFDSRDGSFEAGTLAATGGRGVDVVLNALSGQAIEQGLRVVAADGWFLELGKRDIHEGGRLPLDHFKRRLRYAAIDLGGLQRERPERFAALFQEVMRAVADKEIAPLPVTRHPIERAAEAFHQMASAQHTGKVVLSVGREPLALRHAGGAGPVLRGKQLVTGGLGGLGLALAGWLVEQGARHLVLLGRSEPKGPAVDAVAALRARGVTVETVCADVGSPEALGAAWPLIRGGPVPLRGIFHLAGLLRDGLVDGQTTAAFHEVLAPKAQGAWNLHALSEGEPLDHFVLYSSAAALLPAASQANYAAANAFLDALAVYRRSRRLPALSLQWGPFAGVGLAAASQDRGERLAERGAASMRADEAHRYLGLLMKGEAAGLGVFPLDGRRWLEANPALARTPRFARLRGAATPSAGAERDWLARFQQAAPEAQAALLRERVTRLACAVLRLDPAAVPPESSFQQLGMDSLTGLELRNRLEGDLGVRLSSALLWRHPTVDALGAHLLEHLRGDPPAGAPAPTAPMPAPTPDVDHWFLVPRRVDKPRLRLLCIPFLGGMGQVFASWPRHLPADVEVQALQLPGRPPRHRERPHDDFHELVGVLRDVIAARADVPYALYGHSLGALLAFGATRALRTAPGAPLPRHLFLGAYPAAHLRNPLRDIADLPEPAFIEEITRLRGIPEQVLRDQELLAVFLPGLRADLRLLKSYEHAPGEPLDVPATVLHGTQDHLVEPAQVDAWRRHFAGEFHAESVAGGHFFVREAEQAVLDVVRARFAQSLTMPTGTGARHGP